MMDSDLRTMVRRRAGDVCEYCRPPQAASRFVRFHVEHIIARQHGGLSEADNLALACGFCNFHKGPNIASLDPESGQLVPLFHPRRDRWSDHFAWEGTVLVGRTAMGRAWADENGDWLHNSLWLRSAGNAASCGACPRFHRVFISPGRATVQLLAMNDWQRIEVRQNLQALGEPFAG